MLSIHSFTQSISHLSTRRLDLKLSLHRVAFIEEELRTHLAKLESELALIQKWSTLLAQGTVTSVSETLETVESLERRRQLIIRKAKEYQSQLAQLNPIPNGAKTSPSVSDLTQLQEQNRDREKNIRKKRKRVEAFRGLPAVSTNSCSLSQSLTRDNSVHSPFPIQSPKNPNLARLSLMQATQDLQKLIRVREGLLGRMAEGVS